MPRPAFPHVFEMKRIFRALQGQVGILIHDNEAREEHFVRIDFATSAEAARFYRELAACTAKRLE